MFAFEGRGGRHVWTSAVASFLMSLNEVSIPLTYIDQVARALMTAMIYIIIKKKKQTVNFVFKNI